RNDRRVIILITDGVPEDPDKEILRRELAPQLISENIRLYVLALGPQASSHQQEIQELTGGGAVSQILVDADGSTIPQKMIQIFSRSFGYTAGSGTVDSESANIDLEGQQTPDNVAVVIFWRKPNEP